MTQLSHGHGHGQPHAYVTAGEDDPRTKPTTLDHGHGTEHAYVTRTPKKASARPEWADGDFTAKNGDLYHTVTEDKAVTMRTPSGSMAGYVNWGDNDVIGNMNVREKHQRRGIATELLRRAREQRPELQHSDRLSDDAQAWLKGIGERLIPPANRRTAARIKMNLEDMNKFLHHEFGVGRNRTGREEIHPRSGWPVQVGEHREVAQPPEGQREGPAVWNVTDHGEFPNRPMFPNRNIRQDPIEHVYRGVSVDEWKQAQERGHLKSDQRGTIADWEGTNAGAHPQTAMSYLPRNNTGHILKIRTHPDDKWFTINADNYLRTREKIPLDRVEHVSPPIHRDDWSHYVDADHMPKTAAAEPFTFEYAHRPQQTANYGATYGQDVEPHGRYLTVKHPSGNYPEDLYETGTHTFQNPKHMDFGGGYTDPSNWKRRLSAEFGGKRGRALSKAVVKAGHDGIVTHDEDGISEIVDLTGFHRTAERTVDCSQCKGQGHWFYNDRRVECSRCNSTGQVQAADHWDPPQLTPEHAQVLDIKDHSQYRRKSLDLAKNVPAGTHVWRGETRHKDDLERPPSVGMHWTVKPEMVIFGNHGEVPEDHHQVVWQGVVDHPAEQTIPRTHPIWSGRHQSLDTEAEVRFRPGAQVRLNRRYVHGGDDRGRYLSPRNSEHSSPGWSAHDMDHHTEIAHNRPGGELMQYQKHYPDLFGGDKSTKDDPSRPTYYHGTHEEHRRFIHPDPDLDQTDLLTTTDRPTAWDHALQATWMHGGKPHVYEVTHRAPRSGPIEKINEDTQRTPNGLNVVKEHHDMPDYIRDLSKEGKRRAAVRYPGFDGWHRLNDEGEEHGLTDREYEAFTAYTDGDNDDLNNWHRGRKPTYMDFSNPADLNKLHSMTKSIDRVADRFATDRPTTVYRTAPVGQVREGDILHDKGYMSTTEHRRVAEGYTGPDHTMMQIHLPAGTHAIPHNRLMRYSGAPGEVILPRNTHVRVTKVHPDHVEAEWHDPTAQERTATKVWMPSARIFGPTHGLDHRLFDGDHLKPDVREYILNTLDGFWRPLYGPHWRQWAKVYFAGSEASEWTSETLEGNDDFDVLIGVDYDKYRKLVRSYRADLDTDEQITGRMNTQFRDGLNPRTAKAMIVIDGKPEGPFENTWYVNPNSYDIRNIRPYAAYDVTADEWAVKPPSLPDWDISKFPEGKGMTQEVHGIIEMAKGILRMPEPYRTQNGRALWTFVHSNRSDAFGPQGEGWYDSRNVIEKALDQAGLMHPLWELMDTARRDPHTLDAPAGWSNSPSIA